MTTSLISTTPLLEPYCRVVWWSLRVGAVSYEPGTPLPLKWPADLGEISPAVKNIYVEVSTARGAGVQLMLVLGGLVGTIILRDAKFQCSPSPAS